MIQRERKMHEEEKKKLMSALELRMQDIRNEEKHIEKQKEECLEMLEKIKIHERERHQMGTEKREVKRERERLEGLLVHERYLKHQEQELAKQREMIASEKEELEEMEFGKEQIIERLKNIETMERKLMKEKQKVAKHCELVAFEKQKLSEREQEIKLLEELQETWRKEEAKKINKLKKEEEKLLEGQSTLENEWREFNKITLKKYEEWKAIKEERWDLDRALHAFEEEKKKMQNFLKKKEQKIAKKEKLLALKRQKIEDQRAHDSCKKKGAPRASENDKNEWEIMEKTIREKKRKKDEKRQLRERIEEQRKQKEAEIKQKKVNEKRQKVEKIERDKKQEYADEAFTTECTKEKKHVRFLE